MLFSIISCNEKAKQDTNKLMIPELIDSRAFNRDIQLTLQNGQHEFYPNIKSNTKGFNGHYLGPTIRFYKNESTRIRFTNKIGESTTVHGHGLHVEGKVDGGPHNKILPNQTWDIILPIKQEASTNWYHPHLMGKTDICANSNIKTRNVFKGFLNKTRLFLGFNSPNLVSFIFGVPRIYFYGV